MSFLKVRSWQTLTIVAVVALALTLTLGAFAQTASADGHETFDLSVYHGINGRALGLEKGLPVDVYVNGGLAIPGLEFKDRVETALPAGNYKFTVNLAGTATEIMSFGPADISAGADVDVHAKLSGGKTPILKVKVK